MTGMDLERIKSILPHRYPMLLIDRVLECERNKRIRAVKNVSGNEPFFQGHFPQKAVMPGVLILEAMAQASGILAMENPANMPQQDSLYLFVGIERARFRRPVVPGDRLLIDVTLNRMKLNCGVFDAEATVDGELAADARIKCMFKKLHAET